MAPRVSVIVTAYNHEAFIGEAIRSVLAQTYTDYELIVVDDGSVDETYSQASRFRERATLIRQPNRGVAESRNTGIRHAKGELLAFLDGDDLWEPEKLACQVAVADEHPASGLIAVDGVQFSRSSILQESLFARSVTELLSSQASVTLRCYEGLLRENLISTTSQVMIPRHVFDVIGLSDAAFRVASDHDLYIRIAARYEITFVGRHLTRWRYLPTSASGPEDIRWLRWAADDIGILKKQLRCGPPSCHSVIREILRHSVREAAGTAYYYGIKSDRALARRYLLALFRENWTSPVSFSYLVALHVPQSVIRTVGTSLRRLLRLPQ